MSPQLIASIINAAARAGTVSARSVSGSMGVVSTPQIAIPRRCAIYQLEHRGAPHSHIRAAFGISALDLHTSLLIASCMCRLEPDATIHRAIAATVPGSFTMESITLDPESIIRAAADSVGCDPSHITEKRRSAIQRDARQAAIYLCHTQGIDRDRLAEIFQLSATTGIYQAFRTAQDLSVTDIPFVKLLSRIHHRAVDLSHLQAAAL